MTLLGGKHVQHGKDTMSIRVANEGPGPKLLTSRRFWRQRVEVQRDIVISALATLCFIEADRLQSKDCLACRFVKHCIATLVKARTRGLDDRSTSRLAQRGQVETCNYPLH